MGFASRFDVCLRLVGGGEERAIGMNAGCGLVGGGGWKVIF